MSFENFPILRRGLMDWDKVLLPPEEFAAREESVRELMREAGVDTLIAFAKPGKDCDVSYLAYYTCNVMSNQTSAACVLGLDSSTVLVVPSWPRDLPGVAARVACKTEGDLNPARKAAEMADAVSKRVGVVNLRSMYHGAHEAVEKVLGDKIVDLTTQFKLLRARKRPRELAVMAQAGPMVVTSMLNGFFSVAIGQFETQYRAIVDHSLRINGFEDVNILVAAGNPSGSIHVPLQRKISNGDTLQVLVGAQYRKYWVGAARTAIVGTPSENHSQMFSALREVYSETLDGVRPSMSFSVLKRLMESAASRLIALGYSVPYSSCHLIGLDFEEDIGPGSEEDFILPSASTVLLVLGVADESKTRFILADTVVVAEGGARPLTAPLQDSLYVIS